MANQGGKKDSFSGGLALLTAAVYLCVKGLRQVEERLRKKEEK